MRTKTWRFNPSHLPFLSGRGTRPKHKKPNPNIVPYSHNPPGHTCGLPCCNKDLQLQLLKTRKPARSCIGLQELDVIQQNFTFRGRLNPRNRASLETGFYSVQAAKEVKRATIPKFGSVAAVSGLKRIAEEQRQYNFLKGREITLPESKDPKAVEKLYLEDFDMGETDDVLVIPDDEIEYYLSVRDPGDSGKGVPYQRADIDLPSIYPWEMLQEMKGNRINGNTNSDRADDSSSSNYYEVLRFADESNNRSIQITKPVRQFSVPLPPKLPVQTIYNHPPLSKISQPKLCENYLNQINKENGQPQKFNTYSSLYSLIHQNRDITEHHLSLDRALAAGHRPYRQDVRDVNFLNEARRSVNVQDIGHFRVAQTEQMKRHTQFSSKNSASLSRNNVKDFKEELNSKLKSQGDLGKLSDLKGKPFDSDDEDDAVIGLDNPVFKHVNIDGKVNSTKTLNIDGKLRGTRSLDYRKQIQGLSDWEMEQNSNKTRSLDFRNRPTGSRVMDMEGNALASTNISLMEQFSSEKLISLMEEETGDQPEDDNPITLIL